MRVRRVSLAITTAVASAAALAGCGQKSYTSLLQGQMARHITTVDERPVNSVTCSPHVDSLPENTVKQVRCTVDFEDGTSYVSAALIETQDAVQGGEPAPYTFTWDPPPPSDPATAGAARPSGEAATVAATGTASLLQAGNLDAAVAKLRKRFGARGSVVQMTIFPGQIVAVMADGGKATVATAGVGGAFAVGPRRPFEGTREAIYVSQISGAVVGRLVKRLSTGYGGAVARVDRVVLNTGKAAHAAASWDIYLGRGSKRYRASITGAGLRRVADGGA